MSAVAMRDGAVAKRRAARAFALSPGLRFFSWNGRTLVHVSAVPLPYVSLGDALARALSSFEDGQTVDAVADEAGLAPGEPRAAFARFVDALDRAGVLQDPERPDPIKSNPSSRVTGEPSAASCSRGPPARRVARRSPRMTRRSRSTASSMTSTPRSRTSR
jgi:hypothetical protein